MSDLNKKDYFFTYTAVIVQETPMSVKGNGKCVTYTRCTHLVFTTAKERKLIVILRLLSF